MAEYKTGDIVKGQVTGIEKYGVFINLDDEYTGLIHISEVSNDFVKDINKFVNIGEIVYCQIIDVDAQQKQLKLSIKDINYKANVKGKIIESRLGFLPLKQNLNKWIEDKISKIEKSNSK